MEGMTHCLRSKFFWIFLWSDAVLYCCRKFETFREYAGRNLFWKEFSCEVMQFCIAVENSRHFENTLEEIYCSERLSKKTCWKGKISEKFFFGNLSRFLRIHLSLRCHGFDFRIRRFCRTDLLNLIFLCWFLVYFAPFQKHFYVFCNSTEFVYDHGNV